MKRHPIGAKLIVALAFSASILPAAGCVGFFAHLLYVFQGGPQVPAECEALEGARVAVVCVSSGSAYGPDSISTTLARQVGLLLRQNIKEVEVISHSKVEDWLDNNHWENVNYIEIGRGLKADYVVAIDVDSMSLQDGQTLYKGRAEFDVTVLDIAADGEEVFSSPSESFAYPVNSVHHVHDMPKNRFRQMFIAKMSTHISRKFYAYPMAENFAQDSPAF